MKSAKKFLCLVLAVVMTLSLMSVGVFAADDSASVTRTDLISDLFDNLFGGTTTAADGTGLVDAGNGNENVHGIVEVALDNILNGIASGTFTHGIVTVNTGDLFKDIASHSDYTHGIVTVTGNTTTINFGKLLNDVSSSDADTSSAAQSTLLSVLQALGVSAAQSKTALAELLSGKLTNEGLAALVTALSGGKVADAAAIAQILAALNNAGCVATAALTSQLQALLAASTDKAGFLTDVTKALVGASTQNKTTLAGVLESLFGNSVISQGVLASVVKNLNDNLATDLKTLLENGITGGNLSDVLKTLISAGSYTNAQIVSNLTNIIANGTMTQKGLQQIIKGLFDNAFSGDDIAAVLQAMLNKGAIGEAAMASFLSSLVTADATLKSKMLEVIGQLLPSGGSSSSSALLKLFLTMAGTTAADIQAKLLKLIQAGNSGTLLTYLKSLFGSASSSTLLSRLQALLSGSGLSNLTSLFSKLNSLLGLGDTTIDDENTALAGGLVLDDVNHYAYTSGYPDGAWRPGNYVTRAEVAVMLYALLTDDSKSMYTSTTNSSFTDLVPGSWYYTAVCTMAAGGVAAGYSDRTFRPNAYITRAEFVTMVCAFYGLSEGTNKFNDVSPSAWYYKYVLTASVNGWGTGYSDGSFRPQNDITRAEAVTMLNSVLNRSCDLSYVASHSVRTFTDIRSGAWYYGQVLESANGHNYTRPTSTTESWTGLK